MPYNSACDLVVCGIFRIVPSLPQLPSDHLPYPKRKSYSLAVTLHQTVPVTTPSTPDL